VPPGGSRLLDSLGNRQPYKGLFLAEISQKVWKSLWKSGPTLK